MSNIVGLDGTPVNAPKSQQVRQSHVYLLTKKNGDTITVEGKLFIAPIFIAIENEEGEFDYIVNFEDFSSILNVDTSESVEAA